jgi:hypothetical protein
LEKTVIGSPEDAYELSPAGKKGGREGGREGRKGRRKGRRDREEG